MERVLVIGTEGRSTQAVTRALRSEGRTYSVVATLEDALDAAARQPPRTVIVDCASQLFPKAALEHFVFSLRQFCSSRVLAIVRSMQAVDQRFLLGVDAFLRWPFEPSELLIRLKGIEARPRPADVGNVISNGPLVIDTEGRKVTVRGRLVQLTYLEFQLLHLLASQPGRVFTRGDLIRLVWTREDIKETRRVDVVVCKLRAKIQSPRHSLIESVPRVGYRLKARSSLRRKSVTWL